MDELDMPIAKRKGIRNKKEPQRLGQWIGYALPVYEEEDVPTTLNKVEKSSEREEWWNAMREEMKSLDKNETWVLCELPKGRKAIGCKWVYSKKEEANGTTRFKARLETVLLYDLHIVLLIEHRNTTQ